MSSGYDRERRRRGPHEGNGKHGDADGDAHFAAGVYLNGEQHAQSGVSVDRNGERPAIAADLPAMHRPRDQRPYYVCDLESRQHPIERWCPIWVALVREQGRPKSAWVFGTSGERSDDVMREVRDWVAWRGGRLAAV